MPEKHSSSSGSDSDSDGSSSSSSSSSGSDSSSSSASSKSSKSSKSSVSSKKSPKVKSKSPSREPIVTEKPESAEEIVPSAEATPPLVETIEAPVSEMVEQQASETEDKSKSEETVKESKEDGEQSSSDEDEKENEANNAVEKKDGEEKEKVKEKESEKSVEVDEANSGELKKNQTEKKKQDVERRDKDKSRRSTERRRSSDRKRKSSRSRSRHDRYRDDRRTERYDRRYRSRSRSRSRNRRRRTRSRSRSRSHDYRRRNRSRDRGRDRRRNDDNEKRSKRDKSKSKSKEPESQNKEAITTKEQKTVDILTSRTGGAYIPPAKLRALQAEITDKTSAAFQRIAWEALKKSIHGFINKVNVDNIGVITRQLLKENIVRGRGLLCRSIIQAQAASPTFTHVYAALVAVINSKFPNIGELLLHRLVIQFKRGFRRNDKAVCISATRFIAHLINQRVAHEILALEILTLLVEMPTDDSVEVAIAFLKECGMKLQEVSSKGVNAIFEMLKNILHEGKLDKRVQYMIEVVFQVRKDGFKDHVAVAESLELVEEDDQFTHLIMLDEATDTQDILNVFKFDPEYAATEEKYKGLSKELLGSDASDDDDDDGSSGSGGSSGSESDDEAEKNETEAKGDVIIDQTETNLIALRRIIYLTIHSSLDYEECAHKLMKMQLKPGQEMELCHMFLDCCSEQRTYEKFYGLLAQRFCLINKVYIEPFEEIFRNTYATTHRLDTNRLRNVGKFFAHLLFTDAIHWEVMACIQLNEEDTTSSSRIFIKILFQELSEYMGLGKLNARLKDPTLQNSYTGLFPRDNPRNTRFAINFFTSIGLGGLTDELRDFLKNAPKLMPTIVQEKEASSSSSSSSSSSDSSSSDSSSDSDSSDSSSDSSSSSSSSSDSEPVKKKKRVDKHREKTTNKNSKSRKDDRKNEKNGKNDKHDKKDKKVEKKKSSKVNPFSADKRKDRRSRERKRGESRDRKNSRSRDRKRSKENGHRRMLDETESRRSKDRKTRRGSKSEKSDNENRRRDKRKNSDRRDSDRTDNRSDSYRARKERKVSSERG